MASDYRIRIVLSEDEHLYCGKCSEMVDGTNHPKGEESTVFIGDPEEMEYTILCNPCYEAEGREAGKED